MKIYNKIDLLHPYIREHVEKVLYTIIQESLPFVIFETWRDPLRQALLYAQGRYYPGNIVTRTVKSFHCIGCAVDFVLCDKDGKIGDFSWNYEGHEDEWKRLGEIAVNCGFEWGGSWQHPDRPHLQMADNLPMDVIINYDRTPYPDRATLDYLGRLSDARIYLQLIINSINGN